MLDRAVFDNISHEELSDALLVESLRRRRQALNATLRPGSGREIRRHSFQIILKRIDDLPERPEQPERKAAPVRHRFAIRLAPYAAPPPPKLSSPPPPAAAAQIYDDCGDGYDCGDYGGGGGASPSISGGGGGGESLGGGSGGASPSGSSGGGSSGAASPSSNDGGGGGESLSLGGGSGASPSSTGGGAPSSPATWEAMAEAVAAGTVSAREWEAAERAADGPPARKPIPWDPAEDLAMWRLLLQVIDASEKLSHAAYPPGNGRELGRPDLSRIGQPRGGRSKDSLWMNLAAQARLKGCKRTLNSIKARVWRMARDSTLPLLD